MLSNHENVVKLNAHCGGVFKFGSSLEALGPRPGIKLAHSNGVLCERCEELDIDKIFAPMGRHSHKGNDVAALSYISEKSVTAPCSLCRLFAAIRVTDTAQLDYPDYRLQRMSFLEASPDVDRYALPRNIQVRDCICLAVVPRSTQIQRRLRFDCEETGLICLIRPEAEKAALFNARVLQPDIVDFQLLKGWIAFCQQFHPTKCKINKNNYLSPLKVIDCRMRSVIEAPPNCMYAALSYVWGPQHEKSDQHTGNFRLPSMVPRTIDDAISLVQVLGWNYLWVDRYCIDQNDDNDKREQIGRMGEIYGGSIITIIAAAGDDDEFGLPGVGSRPRKPQPHAYVRGRLLVSTLRRPEHAIHTSKWATRGWTYQEAALSTRRLVFTQEQVYFECKGMNCCESIDKSLSILHRKKGEEGFRTNVKRGYFESYNGGTAIRNYGEKRSSIEELRSHIALFSARKLSHASDSMDAFLGILKHYGNCQPAIYHFWGLPTSYPVNRGTGHPFIASLLWTHKDEEKIPVRNPMFPSFSWVGWRGVAILPANIVYESQSSSLLFSSQQNLEPMPLDLLAKQSPWILESSRTRCLFVTTEVVRFPVEYFKREGPNASGFYVIKPGQPQTDRTSLGRAYFSKLPSTNVRLDERQIHICEGFVVAEGEEYSIGREKILFILLIERTGHSAERIGVIKGLYSKLITLVERSPRQHVSLMLQ
jgi:hypothetical protein